MLVGNLENPITTSLLSRYILENETIYNLTAI